MGLTSTHTYVELELSQDAYDEIAGKLKAAGYDHAFDKDGTIDMHGFGVTRSKEQVDAGMVRGFSKVPHPFRSAKAESTKGVKLR